MSAVMQSPLEGYVNEILRNPQYVTKVHAEKLYQMLREKFNYLFTIEDKSQVDTLKSQLHEMGKSIERMINAVVSQGASQNPQDLKRIFDAQSQYFKVLGNYNDAIASQERQQIIEEATRAALKDIGNRELNDKFLRTLEQKLLQRTATAQ